ncbi:methionine/alanine import family NSS transporter small subunit [Desulforamulus ferrireducens]|nr:methionine/alanine import family NSS transporter small subunit [Desulforamulus ferrireducens]
MTSSAIFMMVLAMILLWGGAAYCMSVAMKKKF